MVSELLQTLDVCNCKKRGLLRRQQIVKGLMMSFSVIMKIKSSLIRKKKQWKNLNRSKLEVVDDFQHVLEVEISLNQHKTTTQ